MGSLYEHIVQLGQEKGFKTITALCREAGVPRATMTELKMGRSKDLSKPNAQKFAETLGVSLDVIYGEQEKPVGESAHELSNETIDITNKIEKATPELKKLLSAALDGDGSIKTDIKKIKVTCPIDGTEQVIYQPGYRIGSVFIPEGGNNGCEMCHPCNECTICRLKAVSSSLPNLDSK